MKIFDLLYDCKQYKKELEELFPKALIEDASDEIHRGRISITVEMDEEEYYKRIVLNGYGEGSLSILMFDEGKLINWIKEWKDKYPEYFKD